MTGLTRLVLRSWETTLIEPLTALGQLVHLDLGGTFGLSHSLLCLSQLASLKSLSLDGSHEEHYWKVLRSIASGPVVLEDEDALKKKFLAPCDYCDQPYILPCKANNFEGLRAYRLDRITAQRDASRFDRSPYSDKNTVTACSCCNVTLRHALEFVEYGEFMDFLCDVADNPNLDIEHLMKVGETNQA
ncbi:hypothetical protein WJX72_005351 [[Myrmecia] bisecta]|uniref:Uncharacterized protein n=1 Tax=[Myrmecia] bisecta TaxID=41462 RepID=A0AAW1P911_9CHLO